MPSRKQGNGLIMSDPENTGIGWRRIMKSGNGYYVFYKRF